jgi:hypothetical protein
MVTEKCKILATAPLCKSRADTASTGTATFNLAKGSGISAPASPFGTLVFSTGNKLGAYTVASDEIFDPATDDYLRITPPGTQDATLANITIDIHSIRIP